MRMRLGLVVGFGAGYYLGAKAGHERYDEINRFVAEVKRSDAYDTATDKAKAAVELGVERARDLVGDRGADGRDTPRSPTIVATGNGSAAEPLIPGGEG